MDISKMLKAAIKPKEDLPEIYMQMNKLWKDFEDSPNLEPAKWSEAEGMKDLFPLNEEQLGELFNKLPFARDQVLAMS